MNEKVMQLLLLKDSQDKLNTIQSEINSIRSKSALSFMDNQSILHLEMEFKATRKRLRDASLKKSREAYKKKGYKYNGSKPATYSKAI